jgi:hypothetical protein
MELGRRAQLTQPYTVYLYTHPLIGDLMLIDDDITIVTCGPPIIKKVSCYNMS